MVHLTEEQPSCISDPAGLQAGRDVSEFHFEASLGGFQTVLEEEIAASSHSHMVKLSSIRDKPGLLFTSNFTTQEEGDRSMIEGKLERAVGQYVLQRIFFLLLFSIRTGGSVTSSVLLSNHSML